MATGAAVHFPAGGDEMVVEAGGQVTVRAGGEVDIEAGGSLKVAGVALTPSAAEYNRLAGVQPGTAAASKAAVLGATKNLDTLGLPVSGLMIGASGAECGGRSHGGGAQSAGTGCGSGVQARARPA